MSHQDAVEVGSSYRRSGDLAVRSIGGDTLLMPVRSNGTGPENIFILNETGSLVWRVLAEPAPLEAVVQAIEAEFAVSREQAESDAVAFLEVLGKARLIERV